MIGLLRGWIVTAFEQPPVLVPIEEIEIDFPPETISESVE